MAHAHRPHAPNRLGRGLSSLISSGSAPSADPETPVPAASAPPSDGTPREVPVDAIAPNPHQPRRTFDEAALAELAASVARQGVLQPLLVVERDGDDGLQYVLIAGERRLRAARQAGLPTVPCVVRTAGPREMLEWSLIENIQRADLNPVERAQAYRHYMDRFGLTQADVAERTGESRASVANYLRMLDLCEDVQAMLLDERLTFGHAKALAGLAGQAETQTALARRIVRDGLSVRQAEQLVAARRDTPSGEPPTETAPSRPAYVVDLEKRLTEAVGTRVAIRPGRGKNRGRIVIEYYSLDDFDRIATALGLEDAG